METGKPVHTGSEAYTGRIIVKLTGKGYCAGGKGVGGVVNLMQDGTGNRYRKIEKPGFGVL
jgi:hypothetical protein